MLPSALLAWDAYLRGRETSWEHAEQLAQDSMWRGASAGHSDGYEGQLLVTFESL